MRDAFVPQRVRRGMLLASLPALGLIAGASPQQGPPPRPSLGPGESNWAPPPGNPEGGLGTADLTSGLTPAGLVAALVGPGVAVSNVTFTGSKLAAGTFSGGTGIVGFERGIVLGSGNVASVAGPNAGDATSTSSGLAGDADLDGLVPGFTTHDAAVLEFDVDCPSPLVLSLEYRFASEEYGEFVHSNFNDVLGFFLNGKNIALLPGTSTPVSVNSVNGVDPSGPPGGAIGSLYVDNGAGALDTEMDGMTVSLFATATVNPGLNHIKLAIADAGDFVLDSNVFIDGESSIFQAPGVCQVQSAGFWKNHKEDWPALPVCAGGAKGLVLGTLCYDLFACVKILEENPPNQNGIVQLAHQLIAAKVNLLLCGPCSAIDQAIADADALIGSQLIPPWGIGFVLQADASPVTTLLEAFNNGQVACP